MLTFRVESNVAEVVASLKAKNAVLMEALVQKMTFMMTKVQQKVITEKLSGQVLNQRSGVLAGSIANPTATIEGTNIVGTLDWGGGAAWYGRVHEFGGRRTYVINPLGLSGTRVHSKGQKRRFGKDVLRFIGSDGTVVFSQYAFHPPLPARPFMGPTLQEMKAEFVEELRKTIIGTLS